MGETLMQRRRVSDEAHFRGVKSSFGREDYDGTLQKQLRLTTCQQPR